MVWMLHVLHVFWHKWLNVSEALRYPRKCFCPKCFDVELVFSFATKTNWMKLYCVTRLSVRFGNIVTQTNIAVRNVATLNFIFLSETFRRPSECFRTVPMQTYTTQKWYFVFELFRHVTSFSHFLPKNILKTMWQTKTIVRIRRQTEIDIQTKTDTKLTFRVRIVPTHNLFSDFSQNISKMMYRQKMNVWDRTVPT